MSGPMVLLTAVSLAGIALALVLIVAIWKVKGVVETMAGRIDETLRVVAATAEEVRKTSVVSREILSHAERAAENVAQVTDGIRGFRKTLDATNAVLEHVAFPVLGTVAGGIAGVKAAASTVVNRLLRKERGHE